MLQLSNILIDRVQLFQLSTRPLLWCALAAAFSGGTGCGSPSWQLGESASLTATIDDWNPAMGYHLELGVKIPRAGGGSAEFFKLTTATIGPDGSFHAMLPDAATIEPYLEDWDLSMPDPSHESRNDVQIHSSANTPGLRSAVLSFKITDGSGYQYLSAASKPLTGDSGQVWALDFRWVDHEVQISGSKEGSIPSPTSGLNWKTTFDLQLESGWNRTTLDTVLESRDGQRFWNSRYYTADELPAAVRWTYVHPSK